jgi:hypothetical protein
MICQKIMSYNVAKKAVIICHSQTSRAFGMWAILWLFLLRFFAGGGEERWLWRQQEST